LNRIYVVYVVVISGTPTSSVSCQEKPIVKLEVSKMYTETTACRKVLFLVCALPNTFKVRVCLKNSLQLMNASVVKFIIEHRLLQLLNFTMFKFITEFDRVKVYH